MAKATAASGFRRSFFLAAGPDNPAQLESVQEIDFCAQRFSGFSQPRKRGELVLRMLVTGGPPARDDGGTPHEIDGGRSYLITILGWRNRADKG